MCRLAIEADRLLRMAAFYGVPFVVMDAALRRALGEQVERRRLVEPRPFALTDVAHGHRIPVAANAEDVGSDSQKYRYDT